jgi:hypothetical protein
MSAHIVRSWATLLLEDAVCDMRALLTDSSKQHFSCAQLITAYEEGPYS